MLYAIYAQDFFFVATFGLANASSGAYFSLAKANQEMLTVCESCLPTFSKLREIVSGLGADLRERDKILMDFSTVTVTQAKLITHLKTSGAGDGRVHGFYYLTST